MPELSLLTEDLIKLSQAAKEFPEAYRPHAQSVWRWTKKGVRGVKLESLKIGGSLMTSKQAVTRFILATQPTDEPVKTVAAKPVRTTKKRRTPANR